MPYIIICRKWGDTPIKWNTANWKWSECDLVEELLGGVPGEKVLPQWLYEEVPYDAYAELKKRRFLEILCKIEGKTLLNEKREIDIHRKITVSEVKLVIKEVAGIDVSIIET